eukprot:PhM_4_TR13013/c0_g1_i1/m.53377
MTEHSRFVGFVPNELANWLLVDELLVCSVVAKKWFAAFFGLFHERVECRQRKLIGDNALPQDPSLSWLVKLFAARASECALQRALPPVDEYYGCEDIGLSCEMNWVRAEHESPARWKWKKVSRYHGEMVCVGYAVIPSTQEEYIVFSHSFSASVTQAPVTFIITVSSVGGKRAASWRVSFRDTRIDVFSSSEVLFGSPIRVLCEASVGRSPHIVAGLPSTPEFVSDTSFFVSKPLIIDDHRCRVEQISRMMTSAEGLLSSCQGVTKDIVSRVAEHIDANGRIFVLESINHEIVTHKGVASYKTTECKVREVSEQEAQARYQRQIESLVAYVKNHQQHITRGLYAVVPLGVLRSCEYCA